MRLSQYVKRVPVFGKLATQLYHRVTDGKQSTPTPFNNSPEYWEGRYRSGGNSGVGSYGQFAEFKADIVNGFVRQNGIKSVIEFGCGDGNQLRLASYPAYTGVDVSPTAIALCRQQFGEDSTKSFVLADEWDGQPAELALSMDVIFHLVEDDIYTAYMRDLFRAASRYVLIYASNEDKGEPGAKHVRHRRFSSWVDQNADGWTLVRHIPNKYPYQGDYTTGSFSDFYIYGCEEPTPAG